LSILVLSIGVSAVSEGPFDLSKSAVKVMDYLLGSDPEDRVTTSR